jgi:hypothetical protein
MNKIIYWLPRALAILIVAFFSIFILEGFGPEFSWMDSLMHFLVALVFVGVTILAWKLPKIGSWLFIIFGIYYALSIYSLAQWWTVLIVGGVPLLAGVLFLIEGFKKNK